MTSSADTPGPGGFLSPVLPSPPLSSNVSDLQNHHILPATRSSPLKPASAKESAFIEYVDRRLLAVSRRYEKRFNADLEDAATSQGDPEGVGYQDFGELAKDLELVIDVVWTSGTPSLQTPYLLNIALTVCTTLIPFPFLPRPTFRLLHKLDLIFCSLLHGVNIESEEVLPGFQGGRAKLNVTEKVRMRGLVEKTRVAVVEIAGKGSASVTDLEGSRPTEDETDYTTDVEGDDPEKMQIDGNHGRWEMEIARVYEKTIVELGQELDMSSESFG